MLKCTLLQLESETKTAKRQAIQCKDSGESQKLLSSYQSNVSSVCDVIFQASQGPDIRVSANIVDCIVTPSQLINNDDPSQIISDLLNYKASEFDFFQGAEVDIFVRINAFEVYSSLIYKIDDSLFITDSKLQLEDESKPPIIRRIYSIWHALGSIF